MSSRCSRRHSGFDEISPESVISERMVILRQFFRQNYFHKISLDLMQNIVLYLRINTYILLNIESKAVNAKPMANIDFILTKDRSLL